MSEHPNEMWRRRAKQVDAFWDGNVGFRRKPDRRQSHIPVNAADERRLQYRSVLTSTLPPVHIETELVAESDVHDILEGWFPEPKQGRGEETSVRMRPLVRQLENMIRTKPMEWAAAAAMMALAVGFGGGYFVGHRSSQLAPIAIVAPAPAVQAPIPRTADQLSSSRSSSPAPVASDPHKSDAATTKPGPSNPATFGRSTRVIARTVADDEGNRAATQDFGSKNGLAGGSKFVGTVSVDSYPRGAEVFIDGKLIGTTPMPATQVPSGAHVLRLERDGYHRWSSLVRVVTGERSRVSAWMQQ
jgi:PEGA domain-containing protein